MIVGDCVSFQYGLNSKGMPQAHSLEKFMPPPGQFSPRQPSLMPPLSQERSPHCHPAPRALQQGGQEQISPPEANVVQVGKIINMAGTDMLVEVIDGESVLGLRKRIAIEWGPGVPAPAVKLAFQDALLKDEQKVTIGSNDNVVTAISVLLQYTDLVKCSISKVSAAVELDIQYNEEENHMSVWLEKVGKTVVNVDKGEVHVQIQGGACDEGGCSATWWVAYAYRHDEDELFTKTIDPEEFCHSGAKSLSEALDMLLS